LRQALDAYLSAIQSSGVIQFPIDAFRGFVTDQDKELARQLGLKVSLEDLAKQYGVRVCELRGRNPTSETVILDQSRPHINLLGWGSERCEGTVPKRVFAELEFRIPPSVTLNATEIEAAVRWYLQEAVVLPEGVRLERIDFVAGTGEGFRGAALDDPLVSVLQKSYGVFDVERPVSPCIFGSCPEGAVIRKELGIPFMFGGLGRGNRAHVADEYIADGAYERFKKWLVVFLHQFAQAYTK